MQLPHAKVPVCPSLGPVETGGKKTERKEKYTKLRMIERLMKEMIALSR